MKESTPHLSILGTSLDVWRNCSRKAKANLLAFGAIMLALTISELIELVDEIQTQSFFRSLGGLLGVLGIQVLSISLVLNTFSQAPSGCKNSGTAWNLGPVFLRPHQMLVALPVLIYISGMILAMGLGLNLPRVVEQPRVWLLITMLAGMSLYGGYALRQSARFLFEHAHQQAQAAAKAREEAADAQLATLQAQMNPHFLFNALNTVASLVRTDSDSAESTVENLSRILRRTLDRSQQPLCRLEDEIDYLRAYLAIEKVRFGSRLEVDWEIDPQALEILIPTMSLQPLMENALKHAIGMSLEGGRLSVRATLLEQALWLEVEDSGEGFPASYEEGMGLSNLRERLETLYGEDAELFIESRAQGGCVRLRLPVDSPARV